MKTHTFELVAVEHLAGAIGGARQAPPPDLTTPAGKPTWDEVARELGRVLDAAIESRPFEKICREAGNCYRRR